jgi:hypothetical protein
MATKMKTEKTTVVSRSQCMFDVRSITRLYPERAVRRKHRFTIEEAVTAVHQPGLKQQLQGLRSGASHRSVIRDRACALRPRATRGLSIPVLPCENTENKPAILSAVAAGSMIQPTSVAR